MSLADVAYMQQILDETFDWIWDEPEDFSFASKDEIPQWATAAWDWPRLPAPEADEEHLEGDSYSVDRDKYGCSVSPPPYETDWR